MASHAGPMDIFATSNSVRTMAQQLDLIAELMTELKSIEDVCDELLIHGWERDEDDPKVVFTYLGLTSKDVDKSVLIKARPAVGHHIQITLEHNPEE